MYIIGIDPSYACTGVSVWNNKILKDAKGIDLSRYTNKTQARRQLIIHLQALFGKCVRSDTKTVCLIERARLHKGGLISLDVISALSTLTAVVADTASPYNIPVYSVDTRTWKAAVVGTCRPADNDYGIDANKWPTIQWVIKQGYEDKILKPVSGRKTKGVIIRNGGKYTYDDNIADAIAIGHYPYDGNWGRLKAVTT